jgi:hypothetical protein
MCPTMTKVFQRATTPIQLRGKIIRRFFTKAAHMKGRIGALNGEAQLDPAVVGLRGASRTSQKHNRIGLLRAGIEDRFKGNCEPHSHSNNESFGTSECEIYYSDAISEPWQPVRKTAIVVPHTHSAT